MATEAIAGILSVLALVFFACWRMAKIVNERLSDDAAEARDYAKQAEVLVRDANAQAATAQREARLLEQRLAKKEQALDGRPVLHGAALASGRTPSRTERGIAEGRVALQAQVDQAARLVPLMEQHRERGRLARGAVEPARGEPPERRRGRARARGEVARLAHAAAPRSSSRSRPRWPGCSASDSARR
jgi:hypothetical protein